MRKKLLGILVLFWLFVFTVHIPYHVQAGGEIGVVLDGNKLQFDVAPVVVNDRTLVPMRTIFEALGYNVTWQEANQTVVAVKDGSTLSLQMDSTTAMLNNQPIQLDVAPQIIGDRTLVPLRFIGESANCDVLWDDKTSTVFIEYRIGEYEACGQAKYNKIFSNNEWLFYNGGDGIYKFKADGSQASKIGDAFVIKQAGSDGLYGSFYNDESSYKLDLLTLNAEKILENRAYSFKVVGDDIYYQGEDRCIYSASLVTKEKIKITDKILWGMDYWAIGDSFFYDYNHERIIKKSLTDDDWKTIYNNWNNDAAVYKNELFYSAGIYKDEKTPLSYKGIFKYNPADNTSTQISSVMADQIFVLGNCLYYWYGNYSDHNILCRMRLDGSYDIKIAENIWMDTIIGNSIYFVGRNVDGKNSYRRMNTDGSNVQDVVDYYHLPNSSRIEFGNGI